LTAAFGFAHGFAHGVEAPGGSVADFAAGFVVSTAALHLLGVELARRIPGGWVRLLGAAGAGLGVLLAVG
jgi:urease accessory protein